MVRKEQTHGLILYDFRLIFIDFYLCIAALGSDLADLLFSMRITSQYHYKHNNKHLELYKIIVIVCTRIAQKQTDKQLNQTSCSIQQVISVFL